MKSISFAVSISGQSYELSVSPGVWTQKLFDRASGHSKTYTWTAGYLGKGARKTTYLQFTNKGKIYLVEMLLLSFNGPPPHHQYPATA